MGSEAFLPVAYLPKNIVFFFTPRVTGIKTFLKQSLKTLIHRKFCSLLLCSLGVLFYQKLPTSFLGQF